MVYTQKFNHLLYYDLYQYASYILFLYVLPLTVLLALNVHLISAIRYFKRKHREITVTGGYYIRRGHNEYNIRGQNDLSNLRMTSAHSATTSFTNHQEANATLVLIIIVLVFIICETPELVYKILTVITRHVQSMENIFSRRFRHNFSTVSELLMVCNSSVNFFIYCAFGRRFRRVMKMTFSPHISNTTRETIPLNYAR